MIPTEYGLGSITKGIRNPSLVKRMIYRKTPNPVKLIANVTFDLQYGTGVDVMEKDWDNLIILDALRYDYFEKQNWLDGELSQIVSKGAHSWEFMQGNFLGGEYHDTVYVTSNPHVEKLPDDTFYTTKTLFDKWQNPPGTILPETVRKAATEAHSTYPNKRLIIHFMQPHGPHLGPTADAYRERLNIKGFKPPQNPDRDGILWGKACEKGEISIEEIRTAYSETLEYVLEHVDALVTALDGKSVITSDHGQMLGERLTPFTSRIFEHPHDIYTPELRIVPWFEAETETRRETYAEEPIGHEQTDTDTVNKRLQALGYATE